MKAMKYSLLLVSALLCFSMNGAVNADGFQADNNDACTSIMVGRLASSDGSVMTSHTCDSWYRTWMQPVAPKDYPNDTVMTVYE